MEPTFKTISTHLTHQSIQLMLQQILVMITKFMMVKKHRKVTEDATHQNTMKGTGAIHMSGRVKTLTTQIWLLQLVQFIQTSVQVKLKELSIQP